MYYKQTVISDITVFMQNMQHHGSSAFNCNFQNTVLHPPSPHVTPRLQDSIPLPAAVLNLLCAKTCLCLDLQGDGELGSSGFLFVNKTLDYT
jgi:hypothetical protein